MERGRLVVVLADHDPNTAWRLGRRLCGRGWDLRIAIDGYEALRVLEHEKVAALVVDSALPGIDGLALLDWLSRNRPMIPTVVLSTKNEPASREYALSRGAVLCVNKTINSKLVAEVLDYHLVHPSSHLADKRGTAGSARAN